LLVVVVFFVVIVVTVVAGLSPAQLSPNEVLYGVSDIDIDMDTFLLHHCKSWQLSAVAVVSAIS
jgi:hypothetical protein